MTSSRAWEVDDGLALERTRCRVLVLLFSLTLQLFTLGNRWGAPDEKERVDAAQQLIDHGTLRLPGGAHTKYPPLSSVLLVPGVLLKRWMPGHSDAWLMVPSVIAGAACVLPFQRALWAIGVPLGSSVLTTSIFAAGNPTWPYTKRLYSEPFTAFFVLCAFAAGLAFRAHGRRSSLILAWLSLAGAVGNNSVVLILVPVLAGLVSWRDKLDRKTALLSIGAGAILVVTWLVTNWVKFGSAFNTGYQDSGIPNDVFDGRTGFSTAPWVGLWGIFFSGGRGLVLYGSLALVGAWGLWELRERWRGAAVWLLAGCAVPILVYSMWWSWHGGTCYGPRLLIPFLPLWMLGVGPLLVEMRAKAFGGVPTRVIVYGAAALNIVASFSGTLFMFSYDQQYWLRDKPFNDFLDVYTPQFSPMFRAWRNAWLFPDDINWMWLEPSPRGKWELALPSPEEKLVEVTLKGQALRDTWEIAEIHGVTESGEEVRPTTVTAHLAPSAELMMDGVLSSVWLGGTQRPGQWVRVDFTGSPPLKSVVFVHGKNGQAYPRFPVVKFGRSGVDARARVPVGPMSFAWQGWLLLLALIATFRGVQRWSGVGPFSRPLSDVEKPAG